MTTSNALNQAIDLKLLTTKENVFTQDNRVIWFDNFFLHHFELTDSGHTYQSRPLAETWQIDSKV